MNDANIVECTREFPPVSAVVEEKLQQIAAIQEAIFRMVQNQHSMPDTDVSELANLAGELVFDVKTELGICDR